MIEKVLVETSLSPGYRIIPTHHVQTLLGTASADSRFCAKPDGFSVLYRATNFETAFIEVVVRDRFVQKRRREILYKEVGEHAWVEITARADRQLTLLDLRGDGCIRLGAPTDTVRARSHRAGRALGRAIYSDHQDIDGILFSSRL